MDNHAGEVTRRKLSSSIVFYRCSTSTGLHAAPRRRIPLEGQLLDPQGLDFTNPQTPFIGHRKVLLYPAPLYLAPLHAIRSVPPSSINSVVVEEAWHIQSPSRGFQPHVLPAQADQGPRCAPQVRARPRNACPARSAHPSALLTHAVLAGTLASTSGT
jgi:hypothetical protein